MTGNKTLLEAAYTKVVAKKLAAKTGALTRVKGDSSPPVSESGGKSMLLVTSGTGHSGGYTAASKSQVGQPPSRSKEVSLHL